MLRMSRSELHPTAAPVSPVLGAKVIGGLIPCNVLPEEILADHPNRYRALIVESGNPVNSVADSQRMREAMRALEVSVCIDVFMTETARQSDYVLPAATQFEKFEATFFNFEFPQNVFHLRRPVLDPPEGPLPEPEIHARIVEALGLLDPTVVEALRSAAERNREEFAAAFAEATTADPKLAAVAAVLLYRTLGATLPHGAAAAASLWPMAIRCAQVNPDGVARAGFGSGADAGDRLFDAIVDSPSGWCSPTTPGRRRGDDQDRRRSGPRRDPRAARRAGRARRRDAAGGRPASGRSCCRPANGARSRRTRSFVTRRGGRRTSTVRCVSRPPTPNGSASPTAAPPSSPRSDRAQS